MNIIIPFLAAISIGGLVPLLVEIVIIGLVCYLLWWLISYIGLPAPFDKVARVIIAVVVVIYLINLLLGLSGNAFLTR